MANTTTETFEIRKNIWTLFAAVGHQVLATPPDLSSPYTIYYKFSLTTPSPEIVEPCHRYTQTDYSEGFVTGSQETANCYARLSPNCKNDSINLAVTVLGEPAV